MSFDPMFNPLYIGMPYGISSTSNMMGAMGMGLGGPMSGYYSGTNMAASLLAQSKSYTSKKIKKKKITATPKFAKILGFWLQHYNFCANFFYYYHLSIFWFK